MAAWQFQTPSDPLSPTPFDGLPGWTTVAATPTGWVFESGTARLVLTGSGFDGSGPALVTGATLYAIDWNGGAPISRVLMANTTALSLPFPGNDLLGGLLAGNDTLLGGIGADVIAGRDGNDVLSGLAGNDTLWGGAGADTLSGGDGNDWLYGHTAFAFPTESAGNRLGGGDGNDTLVGSAGPDTLLGGRGNDSLWGGAGDQLFGGDGEDSLLIAYTSATAGVTLNGGDGSDEYAIGHDLPVSIADAGGAADLIRLGDEFTDGNADWVLPDGIEILLADRFDYAGVGDRVWTLTANDASNRVAIRGGPDEFGWAEDALGRRSEVVLGLGGNDTLSTGDGADLLDGGSGDDLLFTVDIDRRASGDAPDDRFYGREGNDILYGDWGRDLLDGGDGNDTLDGGRESDTLTGGTGQDLFRIDRELDHIADFETADDRIELLNTVFPAAGAVGALAVSAFHAGTAAADADDRLIYDIATGVLRYDADGSGAGPAVLVATLAAGTALSAADLFITDLRSVIPPAATLVQPDTGTWFGTAGDDSMTSTSDGADAINGLAGNDSIMGDVGADTILGGTGEDLLRGDGSELVESPFPDLAANWLDGGDGSDTLVGGWGADTLRGAAGADLIEGSSGGGDLAGDLIDGGAGNDTLIGHGAHPTRGEGRDTLLGGSGDDILRSAGSAAFGGAGNDLYLLSRAQYAVSGPQAPAIVERSGEGSRDSVRIQGDYQLGASAWVLPEHVENLTVERNGSVGTSFVLEGNASGNLIAVEDTSATAPSPARISGLGGNDRILGGRGADTLDGGSGNDVLFGGNGADRLLGRDGNDALHGGTGADTLSGGAGNDTYYVLSAEDRVVEASGGGQDRVISTVSYALPTYVNDLSLIGSATLNGKGNEFANAITGNGTANRLSGEAGNDTLAGGAGNDTLVGGLGVDRLAGGSGFDRFVFNTAPSAVHADLVVDFNAADDRIELDNAGFTALGAAGPLAAEAFRAGTAAADADDRIVYDAATGRLFYDADGSGAGAAVLVASLGAGTALTAADLFVV